MQRMILIAVVALCALWPHAVVAQGFFPPGYDVRHGAPYGQVTIDRPRGPGLRPVVILFPDSAWPNDSDCQVELVSQALDRAGIAVAELWLSGDRIDRDIRSIEEGLRSIRQRARTHRLDLSRVALLGCGSGGHFAALVATNPEYMMQARLDFPAIRAVAIINGVGFDLRAVAAELGEDADGVRGGYFTGAMAELEAYSPSRHLAAPNVPSLLLAENPSMKPSTAAIDFGRLLQSAGTELIVERLPDPDALSDPPADADGNAVSRYLVSRLGVDAPR